MNNHRGRTDVYTDCAGNDKVTFSCTGGDTPAQVLRTIPMTLTPQEIAIVKAYLRITDLSKVYFSASGNLILVDTAGNEYDAGYARGVDGDTPYIGEDNYWYIAGQNTGVPAYGLAVMPRIGDNGNWFIGDTDTGVPARGEDYVLTDEDKQEIKDAVLDEVDLGGAGVPDKTLTKEGVAADAKVTGEKILELSEAIAELDGGAKTYVQAEEPTDAEVGTLWYDTDELPEDDDVPTANEKLTFTGAVVAEYDGTRPVTVDIPVASSGGTGGYSVMDLLVEETIEADVTSWSRDIPACDVVEIILVNKSETAINTTAFHKVNVNRTTAGTYPAKYPIKLAKNVEASTGWGMWRVERRNGFALLYGFVGTTSSGSGVSANGVVVQPMFPATGAPITDGASFAYIDKIDAVTLSMTIPAGVEIRVYGQKQEG